MEVLENVDVIPDHLFLFLAWNHSSNGKKWHFSKRTICWKHRIGQERKKVEIVRVDTSSSEWSKITQSKKSRKKKVT